MKLNNAVDFNSITVDIDLVCKFGKEKRQMSKNLISLVLVDLNVINKYVLRIIEQEKVFFSATLNREKKLSTNKMFDLFNC